MDFLADLIAFLRARRKYWLAPLVLFLVMLALVFALGGSSVVAPFIYALF